MGHVQDSGVLRQVLELCGALIADRDQAEIIVVGSNDDVLSGCTQGTTPSRIIVSSAQPLRYNGIVIHSSQDPSPHLEDFLDSKRPMHCGNIPIQIF